MSAREVMTPDDPLVAARQAIEWYLQARIPVVGEVEVMDVADGTALAFLAFTDDFGRARLAAFATHVPKMEKCGEDLLERIAAHVEKVRAEPRARSAAAEPRRARSDD